MGNQQGKQRGHYGRYIDWEHAERPSPPGKPYLSPDSADLPDVIKLRWAKPMSDGGAPILGYLVEHRRTGSPHWLRASPNLAPDPELILTGLEPGWRYQFRVSAENDIGRSEPGELSEPLTVLLQRSAASAPHFNRELQDIVAIENETVELMVQVLATPAPKVAWYKDGFELFSSRRMKIVTENETSTLIIYQAAFEDEGEIKCTATNRAGHAVTKAYLYLEAPPRIRLPRRYEEGLLFEKGDVIRLKVSTAGRPPPTVSWFHNGECLEPSARVEITDTEQGSSLRVKDACRDDRGEYMVRGNNKIGEDCVGFLVTITDRPSAPGRPQVVMTLGRTVSLSWTCPEDDGGCKIGSYIVEYFRLGWDMWLKAANSRQLTAQLADLIEGSEYKFRIKAENPYGLSDASEESEIVFIPDPKRGILKPEPRSEAETWLRVEENKKRQGSELETDAAKRRRALEENAKRLLDSPQPIPSITLENNESESESTKRRRLLEENARKLLDTPIEVLLAEVSSRPRTIEKPPRRKRIDSRSPSVSPSLPDDGEDAAPPVPKRRAKLKQFESATPSDSFAFDGHFSPASLSSPAMLREDSVTHGSSELMLVLYPDDDKTKSSGLSAKHRSEIELSFLEPAVAPPLSLSAPELGSDEPFQMPLLRNAISSSELLHERAMARLYEDAEEEEMHKAQMRKKSLERRPSLRETGLERKSSLREIALERRHSFKEQSKDSESQGSKRQNQVKDTAGSIKGELGSKIPVVSRTVDEQPVKSILRKENRLSSEEREQMEFAKVRERLRLKNEEKRVPEIKIRPPNLKQESTMSSQLSSFEGETGSEQYEAEVEDMSYEEEEEMLEEEEEEIEEEEDYLDEEDIEEEEEEEEEIAPPIRPKTLPPLKPPAVPQHGIKEKPIAADVPPKVAPKAVEEDTYHPRSMIPTRSLVQALPVTIEAEEPPKEIPEITINEEIEETKEGPKIETKERPKTETNEETKDEAMEETRGTIISEKKPQIEESKPSSQIPIATKITKKSKILRKIGFGRKKDTKKEVTPEIPVTSAILPKPILKKRSLKKKEKDKGKSSDPDQEPSPSRKNSMEKKKQVRIAEPGDPQLTVPKSDDSKLSPLSKARNQRLQRRQQSLEEEEEANKVFIYKYSDILRDYGPPKKPPPKLYLDIEELEAHATDVIVPEVVIDQDETATVVSDQEERGSAPDMSEVDTDLGSLVDIPEYIEPPDPVEEMISKESSPASQISDRPHSHSPTPTIVLTPQENVRSKMDYITDVAIFIFACWLYFFKSEVYVIPVLILLVYRQLQDSVREKYETVRDAVVAKVPESVWRRLCPEEKEE